jgi:kynureninase
MTYAVPMLHADTMLHADILRWREEFPILATSTYMVSHSLGAMPRSVADSLAEYAQTYATRGVRAWHEGWWEMPVTVGNLIAPVIGAGAGEVVMHQNVAVAQWVVLSCLDFSGERSRIVTDGLNFPSNDYIYGEVAARGLAEVVHVPVGEGAVENDLEALLAAIDERTRLVSISHVAFRTSAVLDISKIIEHSHAVGALVVVDLYQSAGILPVDVRALNVDFAVGGSVKWLLGGPGNGYLYVRRDLWNTLRPMATGWQAHAEPFAFAPAPIHFAADAFRFLSGTPNVPALYAARPGYQIVSSIGIETIRARSVQLTEGMIALADSLGLKVRSPRDSSHRGGVVIFGVPGAEYTQPPTSAEIQKGSALVAALDEQGIVIDHRPGAGLRIAPHFYTLEEECERTVKTLARLLA